MGNLKAVKYCWKALHLCFFLITTLKSITKGFVKLTRKHLKWNPVLVKGSDGTLLGKRVALL